MASVLPSPEEAPGLVPTRNGPVWSVASDIRLLGTAGYALVLQVAHPTVGAGVLEHSNFREDPWGRLFRTLDYVHGSIYGGPRLSAEIGRRVFEMHKTIRGVAPDGRHYHALEPRAYAWVHATLASSIVDGHRVLGTPLRADEIDAFWAEWRRMGRLIGVREDDLPERWADFGPYFDEMVATELEDNETVHLVLDTLLHPARPPIPGLPRGVWRVVRRPIARMQHVQAVGMLPPALRERFGLRWTRGDARLFGILAALSRGSRPFIRGPLRVNGPVYLRWRREALARGDVAAGGKRSSARPAEKIPA